MSEARSKRDSRQGKVLMRGKVQGHALLQQHAQRSNHSNVCVEIANGHARQSHVGDNIPTNGLDEASGMALGPRIESGVRGPYMLNMGSGKGLATSIT